MRLFGGRRKKREGYEDHESELLKVLKSVRRDQRKEVARLEERIQYLEDKTEKLLERNQELQDFLIQTLASQIPSNRPPQQAPRQLPSGDPPVDPSSILTKEEIDCLLGLAEENGLMEEEEEEVEQ